MKLPPLPERGLLADLCRETAAREGVQPQLIEKDFYLTRLLWLLGDRLREKLLLKGGTLLSKVDLGFFRMSEDADLILPGKPAKDAGTNARRLEPIRSVLRGIHAEAGLILQFPGGERTDRNAHVLWDLEYESDFGPQGLKIEVSIRPLFLDPRKVTLGQLLKDPMIGDYTDASCWALDANEARAEKVRAAFTREAIRDYYDLDRLADAGADLTSLEFVRLVDRKLAELGESPLGEQKSCFSLTSDRRRRLDLSSTQELSAVLRTNAPTFDLDRMLARFNALWNKGGGPEPPPGRVLNLRRRAD